MMALGYNQNNVETLIEVRRVKERTQQTITDALRGYSLADDEVDLSTDIVKDIKIISETEIVLIQYNSIRLADIKSLYYNEFTLSDVTAYLGSCWPTNDQVALLVESTDTTIVLQIYSFDRMSIASKVSYELDLNVGRRL